MRLWPGEDTFAAGLGRLHGGQALGCGCMVGELSTPSIPKIYNVDDVADSIAVADSCSSFCLQSIDESTRKLEPPQLFVSGLKDGQSLCGADPGDEAVGSLVQLPLLPSPKILM